MSTSKGRIAAELNTRSTASAQARIEAIIARDADVQAQIAEAEAKAKAAAEE